MQPTPGGGIVRLSPEMQSSEDILNALFHELVHGNQHKPPYAKDYDVMGRVVKNHKLNEYAKGLIPDFGARIDMFNKLQGKNYNERWSRYMALPHETQARGVSDLLLNSYVPGYKTPLEIWAATLPQDVPFNANALGYILNKSFRYPD